MYNQNFCELLFPYGDFKGNMYYIPIILGMYEYIFNGNCTSEFYALRLTTERQ